MSISPPPSREKLPVVNGQAEMPRTWIKWFTDLSAQLSATASAAVTWASIDKSGSSLTDLARRNHSDLQNLDTPDHAHLYLADKNSLVGGSDTPLHYHSTDRDSDNFFGTEWTDLTDAGQTALHKHDHAAQDNLNSANYTHLTAAAATDLTDGGETVLHSHKWPTVADVVDVGETVTIGVNRQLIIYGILTNSGTVHNSGKLIKL